MPRFFPRGGEYGTRTPVETREMVTRSRESEARIPVVQSSWASLALVAIGASALMFVTAAGPAVFWGIAAVVMATTFVWTLSFGGDLETQIEFERADGAVEIETVYGPTARTWASAAFGAAFVGFLAHCVARFLDILGLTFPTWFAKPAAVLSVFFFIFSASVTSKPCSSTCTYRSTWRRPWPMCWRRWGCARSRGRGPLRRRSRG